MFIQIQGTGEIWPDHSFDLKNYAVSPKTYLDRASALALATASLALENANLAAPLGENCGLITITSQGCIQTMGAFERSLHEKGVRGASPLLFSHSYFNSPAALLAIEWGISGYHAPLVGENFGVALEVARDVLTLGYAQMILVGAFEANSAVGPSIESNSLYRAECGLFFVLTQAQNGQRHDDYSMAMRKMQKLMER